MDEVLRDFIVIKEFIWIEVFLNLITLRSDHFPLLKVEKDSLVIFKEDFQEYIVCVHNIDKLAHIQIIRQLLFPFR